MDEAVASDEEILEEEILVAEAVRGDGLHWQRNQIFDTGTFLFDTVTFFLLTVIDAAKLQ